MIRFFEWMKSRTKSGKGQKVLHSVFGFTLDEARRLYGPADINPLPVEECVYPTLRYRSDWNLRAASALFQVDSAWADGVINRATAGYTLVSAGFYSQTDRGQHINIESEIKFDGTMISILTNDLTVFRRMTEDKHSPPPPWAVFPEYDPDSLGSLQGEIDFWWYTFWDPFWRSMSEAQQEQYLTDAQATKGWAECIRCH